MSLMVNSPAHHEGYHARWSGPAVTFGEEPECWSAVILLTAWGQTIGQVAIAGHPDRVPVWKKLAELTQITEGIESILSEKQAHPVVDEPYQEREPAGILEPLVGTLS